MFIRSSRMNFLANPIYTHIYIFSIGSAFLESPDYLIHFLSHQIFFRIFLTTNLCRCKVIFCRGLLKTNHTVDLSTWNRWESKMMAEYEHFVSVKERQYGAVVKSGGLWIHIPWVWDMPWWLLAVWPRTGVLTSLCLSFLLWKMGILIVPASVVLVVFNFFLFCFFVCFATLQDIWNFSTRDQICAPCSGRVESTGPPGKPCF